MILPKTGGLGVRNLEVIVPTTNNKYQENCYILGEIRLNPKYMDTREVYKRKNPYKHSDQKFH